MERRKSGDGAPNRLSVCMFFSHNNFQLDPSGWSKASQGFLFRPWRFWVQYPADWIRLTRSRKPRTIEGESMTGGRRPGGLTALAVFNFILGAIFSGLALIGVLVFVAISAMGDQMDEQAKASLEDIEKVGIGVFVTLLAISFVNAMILIVAGVGYLKQKKFLGRTLGNVYSLISLGNTALGLVLLAEMEGGGFSFWTILGLIYPLLTLLMINVTFKEDLVN